MAGERGITDPGLYIPKSVLRMGMGMNGIKDLLPWITALAAAVAIYFALKGGRRSDCQDSAQNAKTLTKIETTLEGVRNGVDDIRVEMRSQQRQINDVSERVARVEESAKSAHHRIDEMKGE